MMNLLSKPMSTPTKKRNRETEALAWNRVSTLISKLCVCPLCALLLRWYSFLCCFSPYLSTWLFCIACFYKEACCLHTYWWSFKLKWNQFQGSLHPWVALEIRCSGLTSESGPYIEGTQPASDQKSNTTMISFSINHSKVLDSNETQILSFDFLPPSSHHGLAWDSFRFDELEWWSILPLYWYPHLRNMHPSHCGCCHLLLLGSVIHEYESVHMVSWKPKDWIERSRDSESPIEANREYENSQEWTEENRDHENSQE